MTTNTSEHSLKKNRIERSAKLDPLQSASCAPSNTEFTSYKVGEHRSAKKLSLALLSLALVLIDGITAEAQSPPVITSPLFAMTTGGLAFSYQFEATGALTLSVDERTLPPGLTFDSTLHAIVGNPTTADSYSITLIAGNLDGTTEAFLNLVVQPAPTSGPVITSITSATGRTGSPFNFQVLTNGGSSEARLSADSLPKGLNVDPVSGQISGMPESDGSFLVYLTVTDGDLSNTDTLQLTFTSDPDAPVIVSSNTALLAPGAPFFYQIEVDGGESLSYAEIGPLPPGLIFDPINGTISDSLVLNLGSAHSPDLAGGVISNVALYVINVSTGVVTTTQYVFFLLPDGAANISTRANVGTGDHVLIAGFVVRETFPPPQMTPTPVPMKVIIRAIGPSLSPAVMNPLPDPYLELHNAGALLGSNNDWKVNLNCQPMTNCSQEVAITNATCPVGVLKPKDTLESVILAVLNPGAYTAIMNGTDSPLVGLVELYELGALGGSAGQGADLANISTRGYVQTGAKVMIGGFLNTGTKPIKIIVRAIGPSLSSQGVTGTLADPVLELHMPNGTIVTNDNWQSSQKSEIMATGIPPPNLLESAIVVTMPAVASRVNCDPNPLVDSYTAIVSGKNGTSGVALVEAYFGVP